MIYYYSVFGGLRIKAHQLKKQNNHFIDYSYLKDDLSEEIRNFKNDENPSDDKRLFRCLYCEKYFTAEHINPFVLDASEFSNMKNFNQWDDVHQGHLCEPYQRYCKKREIELQRKNEQMKNSEQFFSTIDSEFNTTLHGEMSPVKQDFDEYKKDNKPCDFPDDFDEWYQRKIQEKRQL